MSTIDENVMKSELDNAFRSANSVAEKIDMLENMASIHASLFQISELTAYCLSVIHMNHHNPSTDVQKVFKFAKTALPISINNRNRIPCLKKREIDNTCRHSPSYFVACVYELLGSSCLLLKRNGECLRYLNLADSWGRDSELRDNSDNTCVNHCVRHVLIATHKKLGKVKTDMGKKKEAAVHAGKELDLMELTMDQNSVELFTTYSDTYKAYVAGLNPKDAIPVCKKALDSCLTLYGEVSKKVSKVRVDLAALYCVVGEPEMVNQVWPNGCSLSESRRIETIQAVFLYHLDRHEDALSTLQDVLSRSYLTEKNKVFSHLAMAKSCYDLTNFLGVKQHMADVNKIQMANVFGSIVDGYVWLKMSELYDLMNEKNNSLVWSKKACKLYVETQGQNLLEDHQKLFAASSRAYFSVISAASYKAYFSVMSEADLKKELLFMNSVAKKLEQVFGQNHLEVGYGYARLGKALMNCGQEGLAVKWLKKAKDIMNVSLGPHHMDALKNMYTLSQAYVKMGAAVLQMVNEHSQGLEPDDHQQVQQ